MEILVRRITRTEKSTIGELYIDGVFFCYTLEDKDRELKQTDSLQSIIQRKVKGATAIPTGSYQVMLTYSNRFKKIMPQLMNVPGFEGVRIHSGNTAADTEGCLLVGMAKGNQMITKSRLAYAGLLDRLKCGGKIKLHVS